MKKEIKEMIIYQGKNGGIEFKGDLANETLWATQSQIAELFDVNSQAITKHIKNIYKDAELEQKLTCSKMEQVRMEGKRQVTRQVESYNLDVVIAVGYRVNTVMGTKFRQWANKVLKTYLTTGFVIDKKRVQENYDKFLAVVEDIKKVLPESAEAIKSLDALELVKLFANTGFIQKRVD